MLGALETIPELGWAVVVRQSQTVAYAPVARMQRSIAIAGIVVALIAVVAGVLLARHLTRPLAALARATRDVAERRFTGVPAAAARGDEVGDLARAFETMAGDLDASAAKLLEEARIRGSLARYLAPDLVTRVMADPGRMRLGGEKREVTVLFGDVCGFTSLTEKLAPEMVVALLNELFTFATEIIQRRGGMIDKFIGDCVMAVWGTPEPHDDDPLQAVLAATDLRRWIDTANRRWKSRYNVEVTMAFGVNTGVAVLGNIGSEKRLDYTVIGDTVNVAARLETMAQPGQILLSEATRSRLGDGVLAAPIGERALYGRAKTTLIFEVPA